MLIPVASGLVAGIDFRKKPVEIIDKLGKQAERTFYKKPKIVDCRRAKGFLPLSFGSFILLHILVGFFSGFEFNHDSGSVQVRLKHLKVLLRILITVWLSGRNNEIITFFSEFSERKALPELMRIEGKEPLPYFFRA